MNVGFCVSKYITIEPLDPGDPTKRAMTIRQPWKNMQTDYACFEAVALLMKCENPELTVQLLFPNRLAWDNGFVDLTAEQQHYMRFLFRVHRFAALNPWFVVKGAEKEEVDAFVRALSACGPVNNVPNGKASFNPEKGQEHIIEHDFVSQKGVSYLSERMKACGCAPLRFLENQLPNGLFADGEISRHTKIFPTGYFDLWGIDEAGDLCLFELKTGKNSGKMGILSELFFYAEYASAFLLSGDALKETKVTYRGYDKLREAVEDGCNHIHAFFLVDGQMHPVIKKYCPEIEKDCPEGEKEHDSLLLQLLNQNPRIDYHLVEYKKSRLN